jgi:hypothetical protein
MSVSFGAVSCTNSTDYIDCTIGGNDINFILIDGDTIRITTQRTIHTVNDAGYQGEICMDNRYAYFCVDANTWRRVPLQGF